MALYDRIGRTYADVRRPDPRRLAAGDYLPTVEKHASVAHVVAGLPAATVRPILVPRDCTDRMFAALWARPEQYPDPLVRAGTSVWDQVPAETSEQAVEQLRRDLESAHETAGTATCARRRSSTSVCG